MIMQGYGYLFDNKKQFSEFEGVVPLSQKTWKEFKTTDIFNDIQRGKRLKKDDHKSGNMPYISSTGINNGVDGFVGNEENVRIFANCQILQIAEALELLFINLLLLLQATTLQN